MNRTRIISKLFLPRLKELTKYDTQAEELQTKVLKRLIAEAQHTEWGKTHNFSRIKDYEAYRQSSPVNTYEELKLYIDRMRHGEKDVLWKGSVKWYAKSSGTTNDKSKFIPVSKDILHDTHYRGGTDSVVAYLRNNPNSRFFQGKSLILGGSHAPNYNLPNSLVGDLSAILIENISPLVNLLRTPAKSVALLSDFARAVYRSKRSAM